MNTKKIKKLLSEISPRPWRIHLGGGHKAASIIAAESIHVAGRERNSLGISSVSYSDEICEIHSDLDLSGPAANAAFIASAPQIIDQLLRQNEILRTLLEEAIQDITDWGCYVSEYFQQKHDLAGNIERLEQALKKCDEIEIEND